MKDDDAQAPQDSAGVGLAEAAGRPATGKQRVLRERAAALAREDEDAAAAGETIEVVEFLLSYETYAVETRFVREVRVLRDLTPFPCTPPFVAGIINVRSQILPVIDIKRFFDLPERGIADLHHVLILRAASMELALLADLVQGVRTLSLEHVQVSLPTLTGVRAEYLRGITPEGLVILDVEKVLSSRQIIVYNETVS